MRLPPSGSGSDEHVHAESAESGAPACCNVHRATTGPPVGSPVAAAAARTRADGSRLTQEHLRTDGQESGEPVEFDGPAHLHSSHVTGGRSVGSERFPPAGPRNTAAYGDANRAPRQSSAPSGPASCAPRPRAPWWSVTVSMCIMVLAMVLAAAVNYTLQPHNCTDFGTLLPESLAAELDGVLTRVVGHLGGGCAARERDAAARRVPASTAAPRTFASTAAPLHHPTSPHHFTTPLHHPTTLARHTTSRDRSRRRS